MDVDVLHRQVVELQKFKARCEPMLAEFEKYKAEKTAAEGDGKDAGPEISDELRAQIYAPLGSQSAAAEGDEGDDDHEHDGEGTDGDAGSDRKTKRKQKR